MKTKPLPNGPGNLVIDKLLAGMASQLGGSCVHESAGVRLSIPGRRESEFVRYSPTTQRAWATRLKWVEKQCAIFLLNAPILYGVTWNRGNPRDRALRVSVGLSLSLGPALQCRYTFVLFHGTNEIRFSQGGELEIGNGLEQPISKLPTWAHSDFPKLASAISRSAEYFQERAAVQNAVRRLGLQRREELTNLDHLYRRRQRGNARLYGFASPGTAGSASVEAELRRLQNTVLQRYTVVTRVRLLTLGILEGSFPREIRNLGKRIPLEEE